jgi:hypothetical protein
MPAAETAEQLEKAGVEVKRVCNLLIAPSPESWVDCERSLRQAISEISEFRLHVINSRNIPGTHVRAFQLRAEVVRAGHLLETLAAFYGGWERMLGAMSAGYTAGGDPAPVRREGRLCCSG